MMMTYKRAAISIAFSLSLIHISHGQDMLGRPLDSKPKAFGYSLKQYGERSDDENTLDKERCDNLSGTDTVKIRTDLILNDILVADEQGRIIPDLQKDDFVIQENDIPQTIEVFSRGETNIPRSIVLIIDYHSYQAPYLKTSAQAAKILVDSLGSKDKMAIITADMEVLVNFTDDKSQLKKALDSIVDIADRDWQDLKQSSNGNLRQMLVSLQRKKGAIFGTGLEYETLMATLNEMFDDDARQNIIVFQGDGDEIVWLQPDDSAPYPISRSTKNNSGMRYVGTKALRNFGFSEVKASIERSGATIYSVITGPNFLRLSQKEQRKLARKEFQKFYNAFGFDQSHFSILATYFQERDTELHIASQTAMSQIANLSGGLTAFLATPEEADGVYSNILNTIRNRYTIGYYPTDEGNDQKIRNVKVTVPKHPEYSVTGRKVYSVANRCGHHSPNH